MLSPSLLSSRLATSFPWPVACTIRGCVTTQGLSHLSKAQAAYAATTSQSAVATDVVLTTLIRQHFVHLALPTNTVSQTNINSYRTEVLHLTDEQTIQQTTTLTIDQYNQLVIRPFLEQEALKELRKSASLEDLFQQLSTERRVFVLPKGLRWDIQTAAVIRK